VSTIPDNDLIEKIQNEIDLGYGDSRLKFILKWVKSGRPLFDCDRKYLQKRLVHHAQKETRRYSDFERPVSTRLERRVTRMEERPIIKDRPVEGFERQRLTSEMPESSLDIAMRQVNAIVEMRKDLHQMLVKLDHLEERFRQGVPSPEPRRQVAYREMPPQVSDVPRKISSEKEPRISEKEIEAQKDRKQLRSFAAVLFVITVIIVGGYFVALTVLGIPAGVEKLGEYGITYEQIKVLISWLVTALIVLLCSWAVFAVTYLQKTRNTIDLPK